MVHLFRKLFPRSDSGHHSGEATGVAVELPHWRYPAVFDAATGQTRYDDFGGRWGKRSELDRFIQAYAVEKAKLECRRKGHAVTERSLNDGSIKLMIDIGGAP